MLPWTSWAAGLAPCPASARIPIAGMALNARRLLLNAGLGSGRAIMRSTPASQLPPKAA